MLAEICNITDDLERKVLRFAFLESHPDFDYVKIFRNGIPKLDDLKKYSGFAVKPIEGDTDININRKKSDAGPYNDNSFSFNINLQTEEDLTAVEKLIQKKGILFVETSTYNYMIGSPEEPLQYTYKEDTKKLQISISGDSRKKALRQKTSPF